MGNSSTMGLYLPEQERRASIAARGTTATKPRTIWKSCSMMPPWREVKVCG